MKTVGEILGLKSVDEQSSLGNWLGTILGKDVTELSVDDLCIALRQEIAIDSILSTAVQKVSDHVLAGHQYDGELVSCLVRLAPRYWKEHGEERLKLLGVGAEHLGDLGEETRGEVLAWMDRNK